MATFFTDIITRGTEPSRYRTIAMPTLFRYLEHVRWQAILAPESGLTEYVHEGYFFVVRSQKLEIHQRIGQQIPLRVCLWIDKVGRSAIHMQHRIIRTDTNEIIATAHVVGLWMNSARRLARIPNEVREFADRWNQPLPQEPIDRDAAPKGHAQSFITPLVEHLPSFGLEWDAPAEVPDGVAIADHKLIVRPSDIDIFDHVNAATYIRWMDDTRILNVGCEAYGDVGEAAAAQNVRTGVKYLQETCVGEAVTVRSWMIDPVRCAIGFAILGPEMDVRVTGRIETR